MSDTNSLYYAFAPAQCPARAGGSSAVMDRQSQSHTDDGIFHTSRVNEGRATMLHKMEDHDPPPDRIRLAFWQILFWEESGELHSSVIRWTPVDMLKGVKELINSCHTPMNKSEWTRALTHTHTNTTTHANTCPHI